MLDEAKRRWVPWLLYPVSILYGGVLGLNIWGTILIARSLHVHGGNCSRRGQFQAIAEAVVYGSWAAIGVVILVGVQSALLFVCDE